MNNPKRPQKTAAAKKPPGNKPPRRIVAVPDGSGGGFITEYRHYRTGKWMRAKDYGYKAWPFGYGRRG